MRRLLLCIALLAAGVLASGPAAAAIDIFGKFTGIDGESTAKGHEKWIDVESYSRGASNPASFASGAGSGKVEMIFRPQDEQGRLGAPVTMSGTSGRTRAA